MKIVLSIRLERKSIIVLNRSMLAFVFHSRRSISVETKVNFTNAEKSRTRRLINWSIRIGKMQIFTSKLRIARQTTHLSAICSRTPRPGRKQKYELHSNYIFDSTFARKCVVGSPSLGVACIPVCALKIVGGAFVTCTQHKQIAPRLNGTDTCLNLKCSSLSIMDI